MARNDVTITGLDVLAKRLKALPGALDRAARSAVKAETIEAAQDMRRGAPRDKGGLEDGIQSEMDGKRPEGHAASTAKHTTFVVHGTSTMPARDFITPAAERSRRRFPQRVEAEVMAELRKITS